VYIYIFHVASNLRFPMKILNAFFIIIMHAAYPARLILFYLIILTILPIMKLLLVQFSPSPDVIDLMFKYLPCISLHKLNKIVQFG
jgi:hypothetical protein